MAVLADHFDSAHTEGAVDLQDDCIAVGRVEERRPTAMRFELLGAAKKLCVACAAQVDTLGGGVGVLTDEGAFGTCLAQYRVLLWGELLAPLCVGESNCGGGSLSVAELMPPN